MEQEYINKITLECLVNRSINIKNYDNNKSLEKDIKFYRKRICQITKDMTRGEFENENFKSLFHNYVSQIIYYFKQQDTKDIYQEEYNDLKLDDLTLDNLTLDNLTLDDLKLDDSTLHDNTDISFNHNPNNTIDQLLLNNQEPVPSLDNFVKKINIDKERKIIPTQKIANIEDPSFRTKGVKKK